MRRRATATILALGALVLAAPVARATYEPIGSGVTTIRLDKRFLGLLKAHGIKIATREGATFAGGTLRFPVTAGRFDPTKGKGTVEHGGTALLTGDGPPVSLKKLQLKTTRRSSPLVAKLGGGQLKVGAPARLSIERRGFGERVTVSSILLSAKFATRLSKRLRLRGVFHEGMRLGSAVTSAGPTTVKIVREGAIQLELDPGITAKLDALHVAVNPIFPAERPASLTLPLFSGKLAPSLDAGYLQLQGGIELLQLGGGQVIWREPVLDLDTDALTTSGLGVASLGLSAGLSATDPASRTLTVSGATLTLGESTAATFNDAFARPQGEADVFAAGEPLARISFVAQAQ